MGEFDFLKDSKDKIKRRRRPQCGCCKYYNQIPDHELKDSSPEWSNKGLCWYRKNVTQTAFVVNRYWKPSNWNCKFRWKEIYIGEE